jgi:uncharacterized protein (TIGR03067 family)
MKSVRQLLLGIPVALIVSSLLAGEQPEVKERKNLEGTWQGFVVDGAGEQADRGPVQLTEVVITAEKITAKDAKGVSLGEGTYKLDVSQNPAAIDSVGTTGQARNKTYQGIFELKGDTLKWCVANPGKPRPSAFVTTPGGGQFLLVLRRKKS